MDRLIRSIALLFFLLINFTFPAYSATWQRVNIGGGGAMNVVGAGPTGTLVAGTDLAGAYIRHSADAQWQMIGPLNGVSDTHVNGVAFDQSDKNIILLATEGGIYRSADEGRSFSHVDHDSETSEVFYGGKYLTIAYQQTPTVPSLNRRIYASWIPTYTSSHTRILRSNNGGRTFTFTPDSFLFPDNTVITKIVIHPQNPDLLLALSNDERFDDDRPVSTHKGLFMSNNGGDSWTEVATGFNNITDVMFHPVAPHPVYIAHKPSSATAKVHVNSDLSSNLWEQVFKTPSYDNVSYKPVLVLWPDSSAANKLRVINIDTTYHFETPAAWQIPGSISLGESSLWAGTEANWNLGWSKLFTILSPTLESMNHTIGFDQSNPDHILWATNQFVFRGVLNGQNLSFSNLATQGSDATGWSSQGLDNITPFILDVNTDNQQRLIIYAGLNDLGCTVSKDGGSTWKLCIHDSSPDVFDANTWPDGFPAPFKSYGGVVTALISDPQNASRVWMFASGDQGQPVLPMRSDNYGETWTAMNWGVNQPSTDEIYGLSVDNSDNSQKRLFVTVDGKVYRSLDLGLNWSEVFSCDSGCRVTKVANDGTVYAGGEAGLFMSIDNGVTWVSVLSKIIIGGMRQQDDPDTEANELGEVFSNGEWAGISGISIDSIHPNIVYAAAFHPTTSQGVYRCDVDSGTVCNKSKLILKNKAFIRDVVVDPKNSQNLYATSSSAYTSGGYDSNSVGVQRSTDGGANWLPLNDGLDWPMAIPIQVNPQNSNILYIGSPGGGNYKINLASSPPLQKPQLVSPRGESTAPPIYKWGRVAGATRYKLFVNEYGEPNVPGKIDLDVSAEEAGCTTNPVCKIKPNIAYKTVPYEWWVTSFRDSQSLESESALFNIVLPAAPIEFNNNGSTAGNDPENVASDKSSGGGSLFYELLFFLNLLVLLKLKLKRSW